MKDPEYCLPSGPRWNNYTTYRLVMWTWMMNELSIVFATVETSHNGLYLHMFVYSLAAIFIGIPLVYSEICVAQYTNCNVVTMWNFLPVLKGVGWASIYIVILKIIYINVMSSWYLIFTFYSAFDPPPWFTCDDFNDPMCMVKSVNVSMFQHCLEAQLLFDDDCGMKTASKCFFEREISDKNTLLKSCIFLWKPLAATCASSGIILILYIKREKLIHIVLRIFAIYISLIIFVLLCVGLSANGTWYSTKINIDWDQFDQNSCFQMIQLGFLSCGTGYGVIGYLSNDVSFRSPATMTSISVTLFSVFFSAMFGIIIFAGTKTMSYFHGEEENILEIGDSVFFKPFASVAETLSYLEDMPFWTFIWFLTIYLVLLMNLWILYSFLTDYVIFTSKVADKYYKSTCFILIFVTGAITYPFYCSDLATVLSDVTEILQLINSLIFSVAFYWIYGFKNHNVDITFMIGIKASYFWKIAWVLNPVLISTMFYIKYTDLNIIIMNDHSSYEISFLSTTWAMLLFYILISVYFSFISVGIFIQLRYYFIYANIKNAFLPVPSWGPKHDILFKSRKMFVPEIMTREFLYRQVRIHGYCKKKNNAEKKTDKNVSEEMTRDKIEWNALTSN